MKKLKKYDLSREELSKLGYRCIKDTEFNKNDIFEMILLDDNDNLKPWLHIIAKINKVDKDKIHFNDLHLFWLSRHLEFAYDFNDKDDRNWNRYLDEIEDIWVKKVNTEEYPEWYI